MTDAGEGAEPEAAPTAEDVHQLSLASARKYSPRCPAEDIAQDVTERWLRQAEKPAKWRGWVRTVTRNRVHDTMGVDRGARELPIAGDGDEYVVLGGAMYGPSAGAIGRDQLRRMLGDLPPAECRVLVASLEGLTNTEIASLFDYADNASVATILARAKARLRSANPDVDFAIVPQRMYQI